MSKMFRLSANAVFEAEDIDGAFRCLALYYLALAEGAGLDRQIMICGEVSIRPVILVDGEYKEKEND